MELKRKDVTGSISCWEGNATNLGLQVLNHNWQEELLVCRLQQILSFRTSAPIRIRGVGSLHLERTHW
jgi:hypothetical protein